MNALITLLEQAEDERNQALAALSQARTRCDAAREQARQLAGYRGDYDQRWSQQFALGTSLEIVRCYQSFSARLDQAMALQGEAVSRAQAAQDRASDALRAQELRVASVRKLIERRRHEAQRVAQRREQKAADDTASRMTRQRQARPLRIGTRSA